MFTGGPEAVGNGPYGVMVAWRVPAGSISTPPSVKASSSGVIHSTKTSNMAMCSLAPRPVACRWCRAARMLAVA